MPSHFRTFFMEVEMYVSKLVLSSYFSKDYRSVFRRLLAYRIILLSARLTMSSKLASNTFSPPF